MKLRSVGLRPVFTPHIGALRTKSDLFLYSNWESKASNSKRSILSIIVAHYYRAAARADRSLDPTFTKPSKLKRHIASLAHPL